MAVGADGALSSRCVDGPAEGPPALGWPAALVSSGFEARSWPSPSAGVREIGITDGPGCCETGAVGATPGGGLTSVGHPINQGSTSAIVPCIQTKTQRGGSWPGFNDLTIV